MTNPNCLCGVISPEHRHPDCPQHPPYVLGLDTALRRTGVAAITNTAGACTARTWVIATPTPREDTVAAHVGVIAAATNQLASVLDRIGHMPVMALIEAPSYGSKFGSPHERAGVWWSVARRLVSLGIPVGTCAPGTLKKWAVGYAGSPKRPVEKEHVAAAMREMWPGLPCCAVGTRRFDECDALALSHAAAQHLHWPVPVRRHHGDSLAVIRWPEVAR